MASQWIKIEHVTPDKPEVDAIAHYLEIDTDCAVGKLMRFWIWADQQSITGNGLSVTKKLLDRITYCPGFTDALVSVGWLTEEDGIFSIPNFDRHNGESAKSRATTQKRVQKHRESSNDVVTPRALPEKRREEKKENKNYVDFESLRSEFNIARKAFPGNRNSLDGEWDNFKSKHGKNAEAIVPLLLPAIEAEKEHKARLKATPGAFCPSWKNFKTWINNSCWTQEHGEIEGASNGTAKQRAESTAADRIVGGMASFVQNRSGQALLARG